MESILNKNEEKKNINLDNQKTKKKKKKKKNRCSYPECNKKLKISDMECASCKKIFCGIHRIKTQHKCPVIEVNNKDLFMRKCGLGGGKFNQLEAI